MHARTYEHSGRREADTQLADMHELTATSYASRMYICEAKIENTAHVLL